MDIALRDFFAAQIASSIAAQAVAASEVAERAYDIADALMLERERRGPAAVGIAPLPMEEWLYFREGLLDNPPPPADACPEAELAYADGALEDEAAFAVRDGDARLELEPHWAPSRPPERPGLASTRPEAAQPKARRASGDRDDF